MNQCPHPGKFRSELNADGTCPMCAPKLIQSINEICECGHSRLSHKDRLFTFSKGTGKCCVKTQQLEWCNCNRFELSYRIINGAKEYV